MKLEKKLLIWLVLAVSATGLLTAQPTGTLVGRVETASGEPAADAEVRILELGRVVRTGEDGFFEIADLPGGTFYVEASHLRHGKALQPVEVVAGETRDVVLVVDIGLHSEQIVVTTSADVRHTSQLYQPIGVLSGEELVEKLETSLGDTLATQAGVSSSFFGPGAGRPIIRGMGGDRVRVLQDGVGSGDASETSPDHAVSIDPLSAEKIEIARGASALLYGGSAIGGVVNVMSNAIPEAMPGSKITGDVLLRGGSVANERSGSAKLDGKAGSRVAWHVDGFTRETDDYEIPSDAEVGDEGEQHGVLENSAVESDGATVGASFIFASGFFGISVSGYDTLYGIPGSGHEHAEDEPEEHEGEEHEDDEHGEEGVRVDLQQRRLDLKGAWRDLGEVIHSVQFRLGSTDYEHMELEGEEVGTIFTNESTELRVEALEKKGRWHGSFGLQLSDRDFEAIGEEAFTPPSSTERWALFGFQELDMDEWRVQLGARVEGQDISAEGNPSRSDDAVSVSAGVIWAPSEAYSLAFNLARSSKLPNAEELYSNGPHLATGSYELGNPDLETETSLGLDATFRADFGQTSGELTAFYNDFSDYIFQAFTGEEEDGLPVSRYTQGDAEFIGLEGVLRVELWEREPHHLGIDLIGDVVRAELSNGDPLPRIPPARLAFTMHYRSDRWMASGNVQQVFEQDRVSELEGETPTPSYTLVRASVGYRFFAGATVHRFELVGRNLTDEVARVHTSFLKDSVVLPGRDISLIYRLSF